MKRIVRIAGDFRDGFLNKSPSNSMCFALCCALVGYLRFCGYDCDVDKGVIGDWNHYWIKLPKSLILDPTADQFKKPDGSPMPQVYYGEKPVWYKGTRRDDQKNYS